MAEVNIRIRRFLMTTDSVNPLSLTLNVPSLDDNFVVTATRCNTLHHADTHCNTLQHTLVLDSRLTTKCNQNAPSLENDSVVTATHCDTLQHTATHYSTLQHTAALYN